MQALKDMMGILKVFYMCTKAQPQVSLTGHLCDLYARRSRLPLGTLWARSGRQVPGRRFTRAVRSCAGQSAGLASDAFTLTEDGVRQPVRSFSEEETPVSMGIVLDLSGSMKGFLDVARESLRALMNDANPADEAFLNAVLTHPRAYSGFTMDFEEILRRVAFEDAGGNTALIDC